VKHSSEPNITRRIKLKLWIPGPPIRIPSPRQERAAQAMPETKILSRMVIVDEQVANSERLRSEENTVAKEKGKGNSRAESIHPVAV